MPLPRCHRSRLERPDRAARAASRRRRCRTCRPGDEPDGSGDPPRPPPRPFPAELGPGRRRCPPPPAPACRTSTARRAARRTRRSPWGTSGRRALQRWRPARRRHARPMGVDPAGDRARLDDGHRHPFSVEVGQGVGRTSREGDRPDRAAADRPIDHPSRTGRARICSQARPTRIVRPDRRPKGRWITIRCAHLPAHWASLCGAGTLVDPRCESHRSCDDRRPRRPYLQPGQSPHFPGASR
jgi:hypothetical protein